MAETDNHITSDSVPWREVCPEYLEGQLIGKELTKRLGKAGL